MRIALAQMQAYAGMLSSDPAAQKERWVRRLSWAIESAAAARADLVVLPELATIPYVVESDPDAIRAMALAADDQTILEARDAAVSCGLAIAIPFPERDGCLYYSGVSVFGADGSRLAHYRKLHVPSGPRAPERALFTPGTASPCVFELAGMRLGLAICHDRHFPEVFRSLAVRGAEVAIVPSAAAGSLEAIWTAEGVAHAALNGMYYLAVNRVGAETDTTRPFFGRSLAVSPWGRVLADSGAHASDCLVVAASSDVVEASREAWPYLSEFESVWRLTRRTQEA